MGPLRGWREAVSWVLWVLHHGESAYKSHTKSSLLGNLVER